MRIAGIIDDESGASAELIVSAADAPKLGVVTERYLLVHHTAERDVLERTIAERFLDGRAVRFRSPARRRGCATAMPSSPTWS